MTQFFPRWRPTRTARLFAVAAACATPAVVSAQVTYYFENFDSANRNQLTQDPTILANCGTGGGVFTHVGPTGWTNDLCGVPTYYCRVGLPQGLCTPHGLCGSQCLNGAGVREWEGWSFVNKDFWVRVAGDQNRSLFALGTGNVAVADPDEWDDKLGPVSNCGFYNAFMTSPAINIAGANPNSLQFAFASSWRPEGFDDADGTNNQTARVQAIYTTATGEVSVEVLHWDSNTNGSFFHPDSENEQVTLNAASLQIPEGATSVKFQFGLTEAGNDWWWAVDNLVLSADTGILWSEGFEGVTLLNPVDEVPTGCGVQYCGVPVYTHTGPNGVSVITDSASTGGVADWAGWSFTSVPFWSCEGGQRRGEFVLGDGVIAVADGDEWTDVASSGTLRTMLVTPSINVTRRQGNFLVLGFDSSWRAEPAQTAVITAEYQTPSGLQSVEVSRWESNQNLEGGAPNPNFKATNTSEQVNLPLIVPPAATSVVLKFSYVAGNNWWWAIDDLRVFQGIVSVPIEQDSPSQSVMALAPTTDYTPCFAPWTADAPAGWAKSPFAPIGCSLECGRQEWRGWAFANREWWFTNVDNQARDQFTKGRGIVAIADPDEWDDRANNQSLWDNFLSSPSIAIPSGVSSITLNFDSAWRPEGFDDGVNPLATAATGIQPGQNNQTATVDVEFTGPNGTTTQQILHWDSDPTGPFFHEDSATSMNESVSIPVTLPAGTSAVKFTYGLTKARNDWYWAFDNMAVKAGATTLFTEDFENVPNLQAPPTENPPTTLCIYFSSVAVQNRGYSSTFVPAPNCSGQPDFQGWNAWLTDAWARSGGAPRGEFGSRTAYVSDFQQLGCQGTATYTSPNFDIRVINPGTLKLAFRSGFLAAALHTGTVEVSFNGSANWTPVLTWNSDAPVGDPTRKTSVGDEVVNLDINNPAGSTSVAFRFVDRNSGYWVISEIALSGKIGSSVCAFDFNFDGNLDPDDLADYIGCFFTPPCEGSDFNGDGFTDPDDLSDFIAGYFAGC